MPKLQSPFIRERINGKYVVTPKIDSEYKWVFEDSIAVDKLDGSNVSVVIENGHITRVFNRKNYVDFFKGDKKIIDAIRESVQRKYIKPEMLSDGQYFGECIGQKIQSNPYQLENNLWIPFSKLKKEYNIRYWSVMLEDFKNKSEDYIFNSVSEFFKGLYSVYASHLGIKGDVNEFTSFGVNGAAEGLVFYSKSGKMAKLRRDMFDWYQGSAHKENIKNT